MNKLLLINGSPRTGSNSGKMLERFARAASKFNIATETIELRTFNLQMCRGCLACFKTGHCVHQDGLNELMTRIENTSGVVLASPVYYGSVTAQLKTFMDRIGLLGEAHGRSLRGKIGGSIGSKWFTLAAAGVLQPVPMQTIFHLTRKDCVIPSG